MTNYGMINTSQDQAGPLVIDETPNDEGGPEQLYHNRKPAMDPQDAYVAGPSSRLANIPASNAGPPRAAAISSPESYLYQKILKRSDLKKSMNIRVIMRDFEKSYWKDTPLDLSTNKGTINAQDLEGEEYSFEFFEDCRTRYWLKNAYGFLTKHGARVGDTFQLERRVFHCC